MAAFNKFNSLGLHLGSGVHNWPAAGHTCNVYLSNATPDAEADAVKADLAEITPANGYAGPVDAQQDFTRSGATSTMTGTKVVITASGGAINTFRYVVLYNDNNANGVFDAGDAITFYGR